MFVDNGRITEGHSIVEDIFREIAAPVLRVCRVPRLEALTDEQIRHLCIQIALTGPGELTTHVCESSALVRYGLIDQSSQAAVIYTLVYVVLSEGGRPNNSNASLCMLTLETLLHDDNFDGAGVHILTKLSVFLLGRVEGMSIFAVDAFCQRIVPLVLSRNLEVLEQTGRLDLSVVEKQSVAIADSPLAVFIAGLFRSVAPGTSNKRDHILLDAIISACQRKDFENGTLFAFFKVCPTLAAVALVSVCRWISSTGGADERLMSIIVSMIEDRTICQAAINEGGSEFARSLWQVNALLVEEPRCFSALKQSEDQTFMVTMTGPELIKYCAPVGPQRWIDFIFLSTLRYDPAVDSRALPFLSDDSILGVPECSLALKNLSGYAPKHLDWLLSQRLQGRLDILCPALSTYVNQLGRVCFDNPDTEDVKILFTSTISHPRLLSLRCFLDFDARSRFMNLQMWLVSICGAGYRFPVQQIIPRASLLMADDVHRLPTSFTQSLLQSTASLAIARSAFLSEIMLFDRSETINAPIGDAWDIIKMSFRRINGQKLDLAVCSGCLHAVQGAIGVQTKLKPHESLILRLTRPYRQALDGAAWTVDFLIESLKDPRQVTRFVDSIWLWAFLMIHISDSLSASSSIMMGLISSSVSQIFRSVGFQTHVMELTEAIDCHCSLLGSDDAEWASACYLGQLKSIFDTMVSSDERLAESMAFKTLTNLWDITNQSIKELVAQGADAMCKRISQESAATTSQSSAPAIRTFAGGSSLASTEEELRRFFQAAHIPQGGATANDPSVDVFGAAECKSILAKLIQVSDAPGDTVDLAEYPTRDLGYNLLRCLQNSGRLLNPEKECVVWRNIWNQLIMLCQTDIVSWFQKLSFQIDESLPPSERAMSHSISDRYYDIWLHVLISNAPESSSSQLSRALKAINVGLDVSELLTHAIDRFWLVDVNDEGSLDLRGLCAALIIRLIFVTGSQEIERTTLECLRPFAVRHDQCSNSHCWVSRRQSLSGRLSERLLHAKTSSEESICLYVVSAVWFGSAIRPCCEAASSVSFLTWLKELRRHFPPLLSALSEWVEDIGGEVVTSGPCQVFLTDVVADTYIAEG